MTFNILAAVPSHSNSMIIEGTETLLGLQEIALRRGGSFRFCYYSGATVSLVRNAIVARFLESDAELLLMLDADQAMHPETIERMIDFNKLMVGCLIPKRFYNWSQVRLPTDEVDINRIVYQALDFAGHLESDEEGRVPLVDGFARAVHVGAGALLLRREALERLMTHYPELEGRGFGPDAYPKLTHNWGFFNPLENENGVPLSEDLSFSRRWRAAGGEIWADVTSPIAHVGRWPFEGSYLEFLNAFQSS
jgi:hypothetical protein